MSPRMKPPVPRALSVSHIFIDTAWLLVTMLCYVNGHQNTSVESCWCNACLCVCCGIRANPKTWNFVWNSSFQNSLLPSVSEMKAGKTVEHQ